MLQKVIWNFLNYVSTNLSVSKTRSYFMTSCRFGVATSGKMEFSWEVKVLYNSSILQPILLELRKDFI